MEKIITEVFYFMKDDEVCTEITVTGNKVEFVNYKDHWLDKAFGDAKSADFEDFEAFLEDRCFPRERANCKELLDMLGVDFYDPYEIVKKTHGVLGKDRHWIKFESENITYKQARKLVGLDEAD